MLKHYRYPLFVWLTVQAFAMPLSYVIQFFRSGADLRDYLFDLTILNVLTGYFGSLLVCIPFYLLFWIGFAGLKKLNLLPLKAYVFTFGQLLWWIPLYVIFALVYPGVSFADFFWTLIPHALVLAIALLGYRTEIKKEPIHPESAHSH